MSDVTTKSRSLLRARLRAIVTGIAFFFPGFLFSLLLIGAWADYYYAGEAQATVVAVSPSFVIGVLAAIACTIYLLRKVNSESGKEKTSNSLLQPTAGSK